MKLRLAQWTHENRVLSRALGYGFFPAAIALVLLWTSQLGVKAASTLTIIVLACWLGGALAIKKAIARPLQTIANLLAALREGDFSIRGTAARRGDALGEVHAEVNLLGDTLARQRSGELEATALLGKVMADIDVAVLAFDDRRTLRLVNRAGERLLGRPAAELVGQSAQSLGIATVLEERAPHTIEMSFPGGSGLWELRRGPFRQGGLPHELVLLTDLRRALREEERLAWQRLIRVLGHEINNSLAPIRSIAGDLREMVARAARPARWEEDVARGLSVIERRSEALDRFMTSYARLAKLPPPKLAPMNVAAWVKRVVEIEKRMPVVVAAGPDAVVLGDGDQLDQLLINLVRNGVEAAGETGGTVRITWRTLPNVLEVVVADEGPGIASTQNLFVPFFTTKPTGSGIGLVLSRQIAEAHRGDLTVENRAGGRGCEARLRLPL